ncbi:MAG: GyrI-like domain-containing protein [Bacteroidetes bacterium]|nr:GyrI-like domain-containing protein [Bacteroidota bacterium]
MNYDIRLEHQAGTPLAVVRRRARRQELSRVVPEACGTVWQALKEGGVAGAGRHVALYLDGEINLEIGVELPAPFEGYGEVVGSSTPAGPVAAVTYLGPYGGMHAAHAAILQWVREHGHGLAGPSWEVYGHWQEEWNNDPSAIRTDIFYLLAPGSMPAAHAATP